MGFFDRVSETLSSAGGSVAQKAKDVTEINRCNTQVEENIKVINAIYAKIGEKVYSDHKETEDPELAEWFHEIDRIKEVVGQLEERIRVLKGLELCPNCHSEIPKGVNFCSVCGSPIERKAPEAPANQKSNTCPNCGTEIFEGQRFCINCGTKIEEMQQAAEEVPAEMKKVCSHCGHELLEGDLFCRGCGTRIESVISETQEASVQTEAVDNSLYEDIFSVKDEVKPEI